MFKNRQKFGDDFLTIVRLLVFEKNVRKIVIFDQIEHFGLSKKANVVSNFCLIGKVHHNFLVPKMIELERKTFMPIQTLDLHCPCLMQLLVLGKSCISQISQIFE